MFTGIILTMGRVVAYTPAAAGARIDIEDLPDGMNLQKGESIAVNGVCLTILPQGPRSFYAELSPETLARTTIGTFKPGLRVNLERAMTMADRLGGHIVQGHVDCVGRLLSQERQGEFAVYRWSYPEEYAELVVEKGSIAVDGISLTIIEPDRSSFGVALIPETLQRTNLGLAQIGGEVNLELDVIAKYVQRLMAPYLARIAAS
jgi:riboflavin synthase, alpha subunit